MTGIGGISGNCGSHEHDMLDTTALMVYMVCEWYWCWPFICMCKGNLT